MKKRVIGVTGAVGSGKSTVARLLAGRQGLLIDADAIGHSLLKPGSPAYAKVVAAFGTADRRKLAALVFAGSAAPGAIGSAKARSCAALARLNRIMHPLILAKIRAMIAGCRRGLIVLDAPLLFETGLNKAADATVAVAAAFSRRQARLRAKKVSPGRIQAITRSQMPPEKKIRLADFVIDNNGSMAQTRKQVKELRRNVWRS